jgi:DNA-binding MarR family transcriptional regulator
MVMALDLEKAVLELNGQMRLLKASQEDGSNSEGLSERDILLLELLSSKGRMSVSQLAAAFGKVSGSTISTSITRLWREKKMVSKAISPENQRVTMVELTDKGRKSLEAIRQQQSERFKALFRAIDVNDGEREVFVRILKRAIKFFNEYPGMKKNAGKRDLAINAAGLERR